MEEQKNKRAIFGLILVVAGAVFLLRNLGIIGDFPGYLFSWPMILIVVGLVNLLTGNRESGFLLLAIGGFFFLQHLDLIDTRTFWPVLVIIVGLVFILRGKSTIMQTGENEMDFFDELAVFGGSQKKMVSQNLQGGKITSVFGGSEIDLRQSVAQDGAVIEVFAMFGGSEIIVPPNWNVNVDVSAILGGFTDARENVSRDNMVNVKIKGLVILGGGEIKN